MLSLEKQLGVFTRDDIINLERFHTFTRIGKARDAFSMVTILPPGIETGLSSIIKQASRQKYCSKQIVTKIDAKEQSVETPQRDDFFEPLVEEAEDKGQDAIVKKPEESESEPKEGQRDDGIKFLE